MPTSAAKVRFAIDTRASQFTVQAFASGLISAVAHSPKIAIREWSGDITMTDAMQNISVKVRVKAASLEVLDELRDDDRREIHRVMNQEVLHTNRFPEIAFDSTEVKAEKQREDLYKVNVRGSLTLHGVTNMQEFNGQVAVGVDSARAYGEFTLRQTDYDIRIASIAGGTLKLQDELKFFYYLVARSRLQELETAGQGKVTGGT